MPNMQDLSAIRDRNERRAHATIRRQNREMEQAGRIFRKSLSGPVERWEKKALCEWVRAIPTVAK